MTSLPNRSQTALLIVDVQNDVMAESHEPAPIVANIQTLVAAARESDTAVIWVQHSDPGLPKGSPGWEYIPELPRRDSESLVHKIYGDAFEDTDLEAVLAQNNIGHLVVAGAETDACIRSTIHGAFTRGYDVTLVSDAHTASDKSQWGAPSVPDVVAHTNLYWQFQRAPGRSAAVVSTAEVQFPH